MHPREWKAAYDRGENITELLRQETSSRVNTEEIIETAYDLQAGAYVNSLRDAAFRQYKVDYGDAIAETLHRLLPEGGSILEPGVGEGTTLSFVSNSFARRAACRFHGFDLSWSRVAMCRQWLNSQNANGVFLSVASIFHAPYADSSFDVVYTSHTMEPNGGQELAILQELYRITSRFLVLLEPGYEFASAEAQMRMERLGYVRELREKAEQLGMRVVENRLFDVTGNPLNPTAITIIEKNPSASPATPILACPRYGDVLQDYGDSFYSQDSMRAYPKIQGIPCLRVDDGIVASHYMERLTSKNSAFERRVA